MFMGTLGYKVANCPLVPGQDLPEAFEKVDRRRVFGMTMEPDVLATYRQVRRGSPRAALSLPSAPCCISTPSRTQEFDFEWNGTPG